MIFFVIAAVVQSAIELSPDVDNFRSEKKETKQLILNAVTLDSTHIKIFTIFH